MKKLLFTLLLAVAAVMPASAQFKYGIEGGLNLNKISTGSKSAFDSENKAGWFIGPKVQFTIPLVGINIDAALQYSQSKLAVEDGANSTDKTMPFVVIPVNLKYAIGLGSYAAVYVATGPQWNWYVGDKKFNDLLYSYDMQRNTFSWNFGVGVHLIKHLQLGVNYNLGFGKSLAEVKGDGAAAALFNGETWKNNMWQVRLAYMF